MARKCSSCGNNGHNSRTCGGGHSRMFDNGGGGVRLFGVQLHVGSSSSPMAMKKCFSMECLSSSAAPAYYAAALAAAANNNSSNNSCSSPSVSPASSLVSVEEAPEKMATNGYLSDGLMGREQERKKGVPWTEDEHRRFLAGLEKLGKGDWRGISRHFVTTRTPTQVASHAQKYFLRQSSLAHKKRRSSLFDVVENADRAAASAKDHHRSRLMRDAAATSSTPETTDELPALSLGISVPTPPPPPPTTTTTTTTARPARALLPPSLSLQLLPRCSAAMSTTSSSPAKQKQKQKQQQHPPSLALAVPSSNPPPQPDLELKISTATARPSEPTAAGSSPRTPPFLGTIRVT